MREAIERYCRDKARIWAANVKRSDEKDLAGALEREMIGMWDRGYKDALAAIREVLDVPSNAALKDKP